MLKKSVMFFSKLLESPFPVAEVINNRFKVIKHLGMGSYGHSYLVMDLDNQREKVLKALRLHKRITRSGRNGFELEKELLMSITHPGFPKYFEAGCYKTIPFYTMEYIDGKNFEQLIFYEERKIPEKEAFKIVMDLLCCIEYLHHHHIIHRDIRIPNVILEGTRIRLIDLGLGRYINQKEAGLNSIGKNVRKEMNYQADFYGLGHFLLFLLYSNFSFAKNTKEKSWDEELDISIEAKHIIKKLLQIEPAYENSSQIRSDIKERLLL